MIIILVLSVCLLTLATGCIPQNNTQADEEYYADILFDATGVHMVDIIMSDDDRDAQLANPKDKTKYTATVVISGEEFHDVAFHTKGNSSLFFTAAAGKDKFSYEIEFDKYVDGQTFYGLDKLNLQNCCGDAASIKDHMAYWLFSKMGVDAPLTSYVWLTINGEDQGLYMALEPIGDGFLGRTAEGKGTLYKPEPEDMGLTDEELESILAGNSIAHDNSAGADLVYKDDDEASYPDIFTNAETDEDPGTHTRIIRALKAMADKEDPEQYLDTKTIIRYFAVNNFLVNYDSYTGLMLHNYVLYENDGRLTMMPWDYDSAYGGFPRDAMSGHREDSTTIVNTGIDSPLGGIDPEKRPMWNWILSDEKYLKEYHDALSEVSEIVSSGAFKEEADMIFNLIFPAAERDPKAFYSAEQVNKAYETLLQFTQLRAESVKKQLDGRLASISELQNEEDRIDASGIAIEDLGSVESLLYQ